MGIVCTSEIATTSCPPTPTVFSGVAGTQLDVAVNIQGSEPFNAFDIFVKADPNFLKALSVELAETILGPNPLVLAQCIDNVGQGCGAAQNGLGIVRVAAVSLGSTSASPSTGRLFSVKYRILADTPGILVGFQNGCSGTSVPPDYCVTIVHGGTILPESVSPANIGGGGDFAITASPTSFVIRKGSFAFGLIVLESIDGFFGGISLTEQVRPSRPTGPKLAVAESVFLPPEGFVSLRLHVTTDAKTPVGQYTFTITATSGELSHTATILVRVLPPIPSR